MIQRINPEALSISPVYSQAVLVSGAQLLFIGGQNAVREGTIIGDALTQTRVCLQNVVACLQEVGAAVSDLVSMEIKIVSEVDARSCARVAAEFLDGVTPAISVSIVAGLVVPGALVEISAVAAVDDVSETTWMGRAR